MRRAKITSAEDLKNLPEDEWVHIPEGLPAEFVDDDVKVEEGRLLITLPERAIQRFGLSGDQRLQARYSRGRLVVEKG